MKYLIWAFGLLLISPCFGLEPIDLSFADIKMKMNQDITTVPEKISFFNQKQVKIRGFLYQTQNKTWILASEPQLKTCCIGSSSKVFSQIFLPEDFIFPNASLETQIINGIFEIQPIWDKENKLIQFYHISHPQLQPKSVNWLLLSIVTSIIIFTTIFIYIKKTK